MSRRVVVTGVGLVTPLGTGVDKTWNGLLAAKSGLLAHLKKEDTQLYPVLNEAAESDANLKRTLDMLAKDMEGISKAALEFFEKYSEGGSGLEFTKDFGHLYATISLRIYLFVSSLILCSAGIFRA